MKGINAYTEQINKISDSLTPTGQSEFTTRPSSNPIQSTPTSGIGQAAKLENGMQTTLEDETRSSLYGETGKTEETGTENKTEEKRSGRLPL